MSPPPTPQQVELRDRHRDYFLALVQSAEAAIDSGEDARPWLETVDAEADNVRAALAWCASRHDASLGPLASAMRWWWQSNHLYREAHEWLVQALGLDGLPASQRSSLLLGLSEIHDVEGDSEVALAAALEALSAAREAGDSALEGLALSRVGWVHYSRGELRDATSVFERAVEVGRPTIPLGRFLDSLRGLGWTAAALDDIDRAFACQEEARQLARSSGDRYLLANHLLIEANLFLSFDRQAEGLALLDEQAELLRSSGDDLSLAYNRCRTAEGRMGLGQLGAARELFEEAVALATAAATASFAAWMSRTWVRAKPLLGLADLAMAAGDLVRAELAIADALAVLRGDREPGAWENDLYGYALGRLATVALERGELERAEVLMKERLECRERKHKVVVVLPELARVSLDRGDMVAAERHFADALALPQATHNADAAGARREALLAEMRAELGDLSGACTAIDSAIESAIAQSAAMKLYLWCMASRYRLAFGDIDAAAAAVAETDSLLGEAPRSTRFAAWAAASVAAAAGDASRARASLRFAVASGVAPRDRVSALEILAETAASEGRADRALTLFATATAERDRLSFPRRAEARALERRVLALVGDQPPSDSPALDPVTALAEELN